LIDLKNMTPALRASMTHALRAILLDEDAHSERVRWCHIAAESLVETGAILYVGGWTLRDQRTEAFGVLTEMAGELASGAVSLLGQELYYAAASLIRNLVETQYLYFRFITDPGSGSEWLNATPGAIRKSFSPADMRKHSLGRFRDEEYWTHCDLGGHPNPKGRLLLKNHTNPLRTHRQHWADLG
jgi:hypothetical protein